ncbi:phosphotransferase [Actinopolymorpha sp. B9G3]|uniref:phosphotransferase n=1 Tax=Actinopolymorpha sp. B9G3 TaxID=3158970 RepID=UPI0032D8D313
MGSIDASAILVTRLYELAGIPVEAIVTISGPSDVLSLGDIESDRPAPQTPVRLARDLHGVERFLTQLWGWPSMRCAVMAPDGWIHGDFHQFNLLWEDGRISAVLARDRLCS